MPVERLAKRRWMMAGGAVVVAAILAVIVIVAAIPRGSGVVLDPERVLVAVFENQTGDPALDPVGVMAGHWITQGLQEVGMVQVVPWLEAQQASRYVAAGIDSGHVRDPLRALAEETGAATVVYGAYYRRGDSVQYHVEVTDVTRERPLGSLEPETAPLDSPEDALEPLRQRVMGMLSIALDERIPTHTTSATRPPTFEVYQAFDEGVRRYTERSGDVEAIPFLRRAFELDTTFVAPLTYISIIYNNNLDYVRSDSVVQVMERLVGQMSDYDRFWVQYLRARVDGNWGEAVRAIQRAAELAPGSKAVYNYGWAAYRAMRPREAIEAFLSLDPGRGAMRGWASYWTFLFSALYTVGDYERILDEAQRVRRYRSTPGLPEAWEAVAFAAMGRFDELTQPLDQIASQSWAAWFSAHWVAQILSVNGFTDEAGRVLERAMDWFAAKSPNELATRDNGFGYAVALHLTGRNDEAVEVLDAMVEEFPDQPEERGWRACIAVANGDTAQALEDAAWYEAHPLPLHRGSSSTYWRGVIAGALGQRERAVQLMRQAFSAGMPYRVEMGYDAILAPLRNYPPFQELMRPKG
jgi:tetratricopeptide (TPR) repeat protein